MAAIRSLILGDIEGRHYSKAPRAAITAPSLRYDAGMLTRLAVSAVASLALLSIAEADELDRSIEAEMARQQVPGLSLAIVRKGEIVRLSA